MRTRRAAVVFGVADLVTGALVLFGVFRALPARWWPVDVTGAGVGALELAAGVALLSRAPRPAVLALARVASAVALAVGLFGVTVLAVTATWLSGVYGPVGGGGAIILALVAALALPYLVVLPVVQLVWLRPVPGGAPHGSWSEAGSVGP
jgi:hypothetical protein